MKTLSLNELMESSKNNWGGLIRRTCDNIMHGIDTGHYVAHEFIKDNWPKRLSTKEINILNERFSNSTYRERLLRTGDLRAFFGNHATKARLENMYTMLLKLAKQQQ